MNGVELNLKCYSCEQEGVRQPRLTSRRALAKHLATYGKITSPNREKEVGT